MMSAKVWMISLGKYLEAIVQNRMKLIFTGLLKIKSGK
jgi:hypothetical protein